MDIAAATSGVAVVAQIAAAVEAEAGVLLIKKEKP